MRDFLKICIREQSLPRLKRVEAAVAMVLPALLVLAARIGAEQDTVRFERVPELPQDSRQLLARNMKECGVGKNAVKAFRW